MLQAKKFQTFSSFPELFLIPPLSDDLSSSKEGFWVEGKEGLG